MEVLTKIRVYFQVFGATNSKILLGRYLDIFKYNLSYRSTLIILQSYILSRNRNTYGGVRIIVVIKITVYFRIIRLR